MPTRGQSKPSCTQSQDQTGSHIAADHDAPTEQHLTTELAEKFCVVWEVSDSPPDVFQFLVDVPDATLVDRASVVRADQIARWQSGMVLPVEQYLEKLVDVAEDRGLLLALVIQEFDCRNEQSRRVGKPNVKEFISRFPRIEELLREILPQRAELYRLSLMTEQTDEIKSAAIITQTHIAPVVQTSVDLHHRDVSVTMAQDEATRMFRSGAIADDGDQVVSLDGCPAFSTLAKNVAEIIESHMTVQEFSPGEFLMRQGDYGNSLMMVQSGTVEISVVDETKHQHFIARSKAGEVLGEMSLLTEEPRSANVIAISDVSVQVLGVEQFHKIARQFPTISVVLTQLLATRLGRRGRDVLAGKTLDGYLIKRRLGKGGMAIVYEGEDRTIGRQVALKMLSHRLVFDSTALELFKREADLIEGFDHKNIVSMYGRFAAFHSYFIVMQYCDGVTLEQLLQSHGPLPESEFRKVMGQVAAALSYAHRGNVIHRDIKPSNVMVNSNGIVKLMDFGLAKPVDGPDESDSELSDTIVGTLRYMAPEQAAGNRVCKEADFFALGCMAYKLLTGKNLFNVGNIYHLRAKHESQSIPSWRELCPELSEDILDAFNDSLQIDPSSRRVDLELISRWAAPVSFGTTD